MSSNKRCGAKCKEKKTLSSQFAKCFAHLYMKYIVRRSCDDARDLWVLNEGELRPSSWAALLSFEVNSGFTLTSCRPPTRSTSAR